TSLILSPSIRTAAGERRLPVFGSRSRPAIIKVLEARFCDATWPATKQRTVKPKEIRIAAGAFRFGRDRRQSPKSLITQRDHRIDIHCSACRRVAGKQSNSEKKQHDRSKS